MTPIEQIAAEGIQLKSHTVGNHKALCPKCSHDRKNKADPCLSVTIEPAGGIVWNCHNCEWAGAVSAGTKRHDYIPSPRAAVKPKWRDSQPDLPEAAVKWFASRGISEATIKRNRIGYGKAYMPAAGEEVTCIQFPYVRQGEVVNIKFRDGQKRFCQVKGAEKIFFGLDDIATAEIAIIAEGEMDKLALEEAGYTNVLSVPDGAPKHARTDPIDPESDAKFEYVWNCRKELEGKRIVLAVDTDGPGNALAKELTRRFGVERCTRVYWPDGCKDANDVLLQHGAETLAGCIVSAEWLPIENVYTPPSDPMADLLELMEKEPEHALSTGWESLDDLLRIKEGELSVVTGYPGSGKSEFIDALVVNMHRKHGWHIGVCSFENLPIRIHRKKILEKLAGVPTWKLDSETAGGYLPALRDSFHFMAFEENSPTVDAILDAAKAMVVRYGIRGLIIDPYNEIEHKRPSSMTETEYVSQLLARVKRFAQNHGVHVWFVAHPAKPKQDKHDAPTLYDISGSANWVNKADIGISVHRDPVKSPSEVEIHVRKVRFRHAGKVGMTTLHYDKEARNYRDPVRTYTIDPCSPYK